MNIICNNCGGARFYQLNSIEFSNPFMWNIIFANDFIKLVKKYDSIDFYKFKVIHLNKIKSLLNDYDEYVKEKNVIGFNIDSSFKVYFPHYLHDEKCKTIIKNGVDVFYYKNIEYCAEKYLERLQRMSEPPIFFVIAYKRHGWNKNRIKKLLKINSKYKIVLITDEIIKYNPNNINVIYEKELNKTYLFPITIIKKYAKEINLIVKKYYSDEL